MFVANYTPDPINWMHQGITGTVPAFKDDDTENHIVEMDDARARHILNEFSRIGLVQMQFNDEPEDKEKESMALYNKFWDIQITKHNQDNEEQKDKGNRYNRPSPQLEKKAEEFGLDLRQPWKIAKKDDAQISELKAENEKLKATLEGRDGKIEEQGQQIAQIMEMIKTGKTELVKITPEQEVAANKRKYASLSAKTMSAWLINNWDEIQEMPEENRFEIQTKYEEFYQTPFPADKPA